MKQINNSDEHIKAILRKNKEIKHIEFTRNDFKSWNWEKTKQKIKNIEFYSENLLSEFEKYFKAIALFLRGDNINDISKKFKITEFTIKKIAISLLDDKPFDETMLNIIPYRSKFGFDKANAVMLSFQKKYGRIPSNRNEGMRGIAAAADRRKYWKDIGIESWNDLLYRIFGKVNNKIGIYTGKKGLIQAKKDVKNFKLTIGRKPTVNDKGMGGIRDAAERGEWKEQGISSWNDLIRLTFGEVNVEWGIYKGVKGLNRAINQLKKFETKNNCFPTSNAYKMGSISGAIQRGEWKEQGISSWNDLMRHVFGKVNTVQSIYAGKDGFKIAIAELKAFHAKNNRLPRVIDQKMQNIQKVIRQGEWKEFGITSWNDMLRYVFNEVNIEFKLYIGKSGFERAIILLKKYYKTKNRLPKSSDSEFIGIMGAIYEGHWLEQNIRTWNDLLKYVFNDVNNEYGIYTGEEGMKKAIEEIQAFKKDNQRNPLSNDKGMHYIICAASRGYWTKFGINTWNDLLLIAINEVNLEQKKYSEKKGLIRALEEMKAFKEINNRKPKSQDPEMYGIVKAVQRGEWKKNRINSWNDLLKYVFNEVNWGKYQGREGLEKIIVEMQTFKIKNKRKPTTKDKEMYTILGAIQRGTLNEFGINSWNNLLKYVFGSVNVGKYFGKEGLEYAMKKLRVYKSEYGKKPTTKIKEMRGILSAAERGVWESFKIHSWNDLLKKTFNTVNVGKYDGQDGLDMTVKELQEFKKENGRKPKTKDRNMPRLQRVILRGVWKEFGIKSWKDMLNYAFQD